MFICIILWNENDVWSLFVFAIALQLCDGNDACRKMYGQDLRNQRYVEAADIPDLNTILTCIVDYRGYRMIAQSMIPGVLQAVITD